MLHWLGFKQERTRTQSSDLDRIAKDADCIRFFAAYWPASSPPIPELSQLEQLRRIASDPLPTSRFRLQFLSVAANAAPTILDEIELRAANESAAIREARTTGICAFQPSAGGPLSN